MTASLPVSDEPSPKAALSQRFDVLGHADGGRLAVWLAADRRLVYLRSSHLKVDHLLELAPLACWQAAFPGKGRARHRSGVDVVRAADWLLNSGDGDGEFVPARTLGRFDPQHVRGRGVWLDGGQVVVNPGVGSVWGRQGDGTPLGVVAGHYTGDQLAFETLASARDALPAEDGMVAGMLAKLADLPWEHPHGARLFLGWLAAATLVGVGGQPTTLWLAGGPGSLKSTAVRAASEFLWGDFALHCSAASLAGLVQILGRDARPVVMEDVEDTRAAMALRAGGAVTIGGAQRQAEHYRVAPCAWLLTGPEPQSPNDRERMLVLRLGERNEGSGPLGMRLLDHGDARARLFARVVAAAPAYPAVREAVALALDERFTGRQLDALVPAVAGLALLERVSGNWAEWLAGLGLDLLVRSPVAELLARLRDYPLEGATSLGVAIGKAAEGCPEAGELLARHSVRVMAPRAEESVCVMVGYAALEKLGRALRCPDLRERLKRLPQADYSRASNDYKVRFAGAGTQRVLMLPLDAFKVSAG